jgi:hypothetical protein
MSILSLSEFEEWKEARRRTRYGRKKKCKNKRYKLNKQDAEDYVMMLNHMREM